jgi:NADH dehydrogenase
MSKVLVLGGGFAGLSAVRSLARRGPRGLEVELIDREAESVFSPLLPDLISGRLPVADMTAPIGPLCRRSGVAFTRARVREIDPERGRVVTDRGTCEGDYVLLALGCVTNYFGNDAMRRRTFGLKSVDEGIAIQARLREAVARAQAGGPPAAVVVVGGGYTGFEAASHAAHLLHRRTGLPFHRISEVGAVVVVEKTDTVLRNVAPKVRAWASDLMGRYGIEVLTGVTTETPGDDGSVTLSDGRTLPNALVIWAAGVTPGEEATTFEPERCRGRVDVDAYLRVRGYPRLFAAGDVAAPTPRGAGEPLRMSVKFSLRGGHHAACNILRALRGRPLRVFDPWDPGYVVPLAPGKAAGRIAGLDLRGTLPSFLHYALCIFRSWRWRERFAIVKHLL